MKFRLERISYILLLLCFVTVSQAQQYPKPMDPPRLVNDYVGLLTEEQFQYLEHKLESYEDTTSNQFAIAIFATTGGDDMAMYTIELGQEWGVGRGGKDNGVLIGVAIDDREVFISTGYGLEAAIPDAAAKRIVENYILPNFRNDNYFEGLDEATSLLIGLAQGEFDAEEIAAEEEFSLSKLISLLVFLGIFILPYYFVSRRAAGRHYGTSSPSFWMIMALMMSGRGGSGRSGGSSFGDFTGGGGGFGGFGGGGFGGGGAGGSW